MEADDVIVQYCDWAPVISCDRHVDYLAFFRLGVACRRKLQSGHTYFACFFAYV